MPTLRLPSMTRWTAIQMTRIFSIAKMAVLAVDCQIPTRASRIRAFTESIICVCQMA